MSSTVPTNVRKVVIEGLQKVKDIEQDGWNATVDSNSGLYTVSMTLNEDEPVWQGLWQRIEDLGFAMPRNLIHGGTEYHKILPVCLVKEHNKVLVVADDQASTPTTIRISETLISHANTHHVPPLEFRIEGREIRDDYGFWVSFERTVRIPDDNKLHHLPASLGRYELFSVDAYSDRLPENVKNAGGVFFSMWQREAMWLNFQQGLHKYAVRVFVGHINAITGLEMQKELDTKSESNTQDYIVIPGQQWLDGICVAPGIVRQFVAMPLGSGYTVEGQKTSEEKHGGLQLEVTPQMVRGKRFWSYAKQQSIKLEGGYQTRFDEIRESFTPRELGCNIGDVLRSYPTEVTYRKPLRIRDLAASRTEGMTENNVSQNPDLSSADSIILKAAGGTLARASVGLSPPAYPRAYGPSSFQAFKPPPAGHYSPPNPQHYSGVPETKSISSVLSLGFLKQANRSAPPPPPPPPNVQHLANEKGNGTIHPNMSDEEATNLVELTELEMKNIKTMGLAAGGKLIQDIYKDTFPATTWNHAAARILHVHMLDPESCEKVTHIVPQPPPKDVKNYVETGGKFYVIEEKVDERLDGGDFDNVKSVSQMDKHVGITTEPEFDPKKPKMCAKCEKRLCDCIIRPCTHQFCNICIKVLEEQSSDTSDPGSQQGRSRWKCPTCNAPVSHVAGFSAPMNLPGEEPLLRTKVPVNVLKIEDGRARFSSVQTSRV